jgi:hypothetical protein
MKLAMKDLSGSLDFEGVFYRKSCLYREQSVAYSPFAGLRYTRYWTIPGLH